MPLQTLFRLLPLCAAGMHGQFERRGSLDACPAIRGQSTHALVIGDLGAPVFAFRRTAGLALFPCVLGCFSPHIFMGAAQRRLGRRGVPLFAYHKIAPPPPETRDPFLYVSLRRFDAQLAALRNAGFASAPLNEVRAAKGNPQRKAVITFDDGCRNVLEHGLESLTRHGFRAIQFVVPAFMGRRNEWDIAKGDSPEELMDDAGIRQWLAAGHEIGSHSLTHRNLRQLDKADLRSEIFDSKKSLEDRFGIRVEHFCYPFGSWNESVRDAVAEAGYATASTMDFGVSDSATPPFELRRIIPLSSMELLGKIRHRLARKIRKIS